MLPVPEPPAIRDVHSAAKIMDREAFADMDSRPGAEEEQHLVYRVAWSAVKGTHIQEWLSLSISRGSLW